MPKFATDELHAVGKGRVLVHGSFRPNSSTGIVSGSEVGFGWSAARAGVGLYTITLDTPWPALVSFSCGVREAAGAPTFAQFGDYSASAGTLQLRVMQESGGTTAAADLAADVDNVVSFELVFRNNSGSY